ncbi:hypothetical protein MHYP_G00038470 [Metynnis hypsauchen]
MLVYMNKLCLVLQMKSRPGLRALRSKFTIVQPKHIGLTSSITACNLSDNLDPQRPYIDEADKEVTEVQDCH